VWASLWKRVFGIDLRTLALFRVMLAITCITEVFLLWPNLFAFFDDHGIFMRKDAVIQSSPYAWSLYYIDGSVGWAYLLFCLTLLAGIALLFGYRTRLAIVICWVLSVSLTNRISIFSSGAHMLLPLLLFWAMFLPLGARFSVDAALSDAPKGDNSYVSAGTFAALLQMGILYLFSALLKTGASWHDAANAIYYVTNTPEMSTPLGAYLGQWLKLTQWLTRYVYHLEFIAPIFLFSPIRTACCRLAILPFLFTLHLGFALFISIGFFPLVCISGLVIFIPGLVWDKLLLWYNARKTRAGITLYYDKDCGFCRKSCLIFRELGLPPETAIIPAQSRPDIYAIMQRENSWVVEDGSGHHRTRWDAVAWCWRRSPLLWPLGIIFLLPFMKPVGDLAYGFIARNREKFGRMTARLLPECHRPLAFKPYLLTEIAALYLIGMVAMCNINSLPGQVLERVCSPLFPLLSTLKLTQNMKFFAPTPRHATRWVVIEGHLANGNVVDMFHNVPEAPSHDIPKNGYDAYPSHYWYKFFNRVNFNRWQSVLGSYYCQAWSDNHPGMPAKEAVFSVYEQVTPDLPATKPNPVKLVTSFTYDCNTKSVKENPK